MARPRKKTEEETPKAEEPQVGAADAAEVEEQGTEELVSEQTPEPEPDAAEEAPVPEPAAAREVDVESEAETEAEPEAAAEDEESAAEPVGAGLVPPAEEPEADAGDAPAEAEEPAAEPEAEAPAAPAAPAKPKRVRRPKEERRARTRSRKARARGANDGSRKAIVRLPKPEHDRGRRKERRGVVVSNAMEKTIVVRVDTAKPHRRYTKVVRVSRRLHAHDERNEASVGDVVRIVQSRPLSKTKHWRLAEVVEQAR